MKIRGVGWRIVFRVQGCWSYLGKFDLLEVTGSSFSPADFGFMSR